MPGAQERASLGSHVDVIEPKSSRDLSLSTSTGHIPQEHSHKPFFIFFLIVKIIFVDTRDSHCFKDNSTKALPSERVLPVWSTGASICHAFDKADTLSGNHLTVPLLIKKNFV